MFVCISVIRVIHPMCFYIWIEEKSENRLGRKDLKLCILDDRDHLMMCDTHILFTFQQCYDMLYTFILCIVWHSRGSTLSPFYFYCFKQCVKSSCKVLFHQHTHVQYTHTHIFKCVRPNCMKIPSFKVWTIVYIHKGDSDAHTHTHTHSVWQSENLIICTLLLFIYSSFACLSPFRITYRRGYGCWMLV